MKTFSELSYHLSVSFDDNKVDDDLDHLRKVQPATGSMPVSSYSEKDVDSVSSEPSDAARKLWCQAGHF